MLSGAPVVLRVVGSLWFAVVLLVVLMVALACGTVFESQNGREQALAFFYHSTWFKLILALFTINVLAAVSVRWPFNRGHVGFLLTHLGVVVVLLGALLTARLGVRGQVAIREGESVSTFRVPEETLTIWSRGGLQEESLDLDQSLFGGFSRVDSPAIPVPTLEAVERLEVLRYLPDMVWEEVVENDNPAESAAVQVSLATDGESDAPAWIFEARNAVVGGVEGTFRSIADPGELQRLLGASDAESTDSVGVVRLKYRGEDYQIAAEQCLEDAVRVGDTELSIHILHYLPHATVGPNNEVVNTSSEPVNPALNLEISGPEGAETRVLFSMFPDFVIDGGPRRFGDLEVVFQSSAPPIPTAPIEVIRGPDDGLHVRFYWAGTPVIGRSLAVGEEVETPWPGKRFRILQYLDHARTRTVASEPARPRKNRVPAMQVKIRSGGIDREVWLQRGTSRTVAFEGTSLELLYGDKILPLGFEIKLEDFHLGYYPGGARIRSYESNVLITDPSLGGTRRHVISMNHPVDHGGYTLFQSGYKEVDGRQMTFLEIAEDPGQWLAFIGFILTASGMVVTFLRRVRSLRGGSSVHGAAPARREL